MMLSRRSFLAASGTSIGALAVAGPLARLGAAASMLPLTYFNWQPIRRGPQRLPLGATGYGTGMLAAIGEGGNALLVARDDEMVLIDCKHAPYGGLLRREASIVPYTPARDRRLSLVINTHHHADHTGGNHAFRDVEILAHRNVRTRIEGNMERYRQSAAGALESLEAGGETSGSQAKLNLARRFIEAYAKDVEEMTAASFMPTRDLDQDEVAMTVGDIDLKLYHFGPGHTDNDVAIYLPQYNVLHTGDLLFHRLHPYIDKGAGATTTGWQQSIARLIEICDEDTIVVPGHGELTDVSGLREQDEYFTTIRRMVSHAKDVEGMTRDEVMKLTNSKFAEYGHERLGPMNLGIVYDELASESE